jgi:hypothetical protein
MNKTYFEAMCLEKQIFSTKQIIINFVTEFFVVFKGI